MTSSSTAITPIGGGHDYECGQSKSKQLGGCTPARWILVGKSGAGKGVAMQNLLLNKGLFRGCFARIHVFSPTVFLDSTTWAPVRDFITRTLRHDEKREGPFFHDTFDQGLVREIIADQQKLVDAQKERGGKKVHGICIIVDDFADDPKVTHDAHNVLTSLFVSGRHRFISTFILTQRMRSIATPIRTNATALCVWKCSNQHEYATIEEETSALVDRRTFKAVYDAATSEPFSFLFVRLNAKTLDDTFMVRFEHRIRFHEELDNSPEE